MSSPNQDVAPFFTARVVMGLGIASVVSSALVAPLVAINGNGSGVLDVVTSLVEGIWLVSLGACWIGGIKLAWRSNSWIWIAVAILLAPAGSILVAWRQMRLQRNQNG